MKKLTLLLVGSLVVFCLNAQKTLRINFEDNSTNGAAVVYNGSLSVVANPVNTGINSSAYCLDVVNNGYAPVRVANLNIPAGTASNYPYWKLRFKVAYKGFNGGTDLDYPGVDVYSQSGASFAEGDKLGTVSSVWGSHLPASDSLVWKTAEFLMSSSALANIPNGMLVLKLTKAKCEYLLDDIELIPSLSYSANSPSFNTVADFENSTIGDATSFPFIDRWSGNATNVGASNTSVVQANPLAASSSVTLPLGNSSANSLKLTYATSSNYDDVTSVPMSITGNISDYDFVFFDRNFSSSSSGVQLYVKLGSNKLYQENSGKYPTISTVWTTEAVGIPSTATGVGATTLLIGYTNVTSGTLYVDNIRLHKRSILVNIPVPTNGTINIMNGSTIVNNGDYLPIGTVLTVTATPASGYKTVSLTANSLAITSGNNYTLTNANTTFDAQFSFETAISKENSGKYLTAYCALNEIVLSSIVEKAELLNLEGRVIISVENTSRIDVSTLTKGIYVLKANVSGKSNVIKLAKQL